MFALHPRVKFWSSFFKSLRVWAEPIKNSVFFLLAFSFALTVSKEKAVYGLDFVTIYGRFFKKAPQKLSYGKVLRSFQSELDDYKHNVRTNSIGSLREGAPVGDGWRSKRNNGFCTLNKIKLLCTRILLPSFSNENATSLKREALVTFHHHGKRRCIKRLALWESCQRS